MSAYTDRRNNEKATSQNKRLQEEKQEAEDRKNNQEFRAKVNGEEHVMVELDERTKKFWRLSSIKAKPRDFCREAGLRWSKDGLDAPHVRQYLARHTCFMQ